MTTATVDGSGDVLTLTRAGDSARFHAVWLRDNAQDAATRDPGNGQRLITLQDIPSEVALAATKVAGSALHLTFRPEGRTIAYDLDWLWAHRYDRPHDTTPGRLPAGLEAWDAGLQDRLTRAPFARVRDDPAALRGWLSGLVRQGVALLTGGPVEAGALFRVVDLFGYVRETNYGRHFEVRTEVNPTNLAYTGLSLPPHTDNPYRDPVPTVQVLYCLESSAAGGENMVVDGFAAARRLHAEAPEDFALLSRHCARFDYAGAPGVRLRARRPAIELSPDGELVAVRVNSRSAAALTDVPFDRMRAYYAACRRWEALLGDAGMAVAFRLDPGDCFVVDNTRVLHARRGYSGTGRRWLQGCYADRDGLRSTLAWLEETAPAAP